MEKAAGHILKSDQVKLEGQAKIGIQQVDCQQTEKPQHGGTIHQVQVVENHPEFAVIQIICSCGARALLRCEYAGVEKAREDSEHKQSDE
jgi:hypothetical protein